MAFKRTFVAALAACMVLAAGVVAAQNNDGQGADSVIDKPPSEAPQYGRSNLPDSTMNGGLGFAFPGGGTTIPFPDPCAATPKPSYCEPPDDNTPGAGNPTPPGGVQIVGDWVGCGAISGGGGSSVSFSFSFGADGAMSTGASCTSGCPAQRSGRWLPAGDNPARYSISLPNSPTVNPNGGAWTNMGSGVNGFWQARTTNGLPVGKRVSGKVDIREDATGAVVASVDTDLYLTVNGECL